MDTPDTPPQSGGAPALVAAARILSPHGLHGHLRIASLSDIPGRFAPGAAFLLGDDTVVSEGAAPHGKYLVIKLRGVDTRRAAEALRGKLLESPMANAPALPDGTYYHHQIIGLAVRTEDGRDLGAVADIIETGANDVYVVRGPDGETLIPAIPDVVRQVDTAAGHIVIAPLPGLL